ncbi:YciI family protein [Svornostia abyssi]|uniref:YciI family protein n=1 Tax=Svornostia abyssi TaxID=2898438 RepID=A0ABY5PFA4_9ACTN|nr:YciI family protein [Parviterribacteraceae bacterium J379]
MRYMLLLHHPEELRHAPGSPEFLAGVERFNAFHAELARRDIAWDGFPLQPSPTATSVRVRDGETVVSDGPFAELKEQLGGYYVIDLPDLDAAIEIAAMVPWAAEGTVEIRPLASLDAPELVSPQT